MNINFWLNGVNRHAEISPDTLLIDFLRKQGCFSVKRGCETANCGLCTVLMDGRPVLSCSTLAARIEGKKIVTLEGMQREAQEFGSFLANEGAEQCGFCNPGFIMNVFAMLNEIKDPTEEPPRRDLPGYTADRFLKKTGLFQREKRLRNCELWSLHSSYGRSSGAFLQYTCSPH